MKKIAYIEIDTHAEIAQDFMDVMSGSEEFSVDYYFSEKIKKQMRENSESVYLSDSSTIVDQLKDKKYDLIMIGTVHRYFNTFLAITRQYNTSVIIHNLNFSRISKLNLIKNIFKEEVMYRLKLWWKEGLFYSSKVYQNAKNLLVLDEEMSSENLLFLPLFYTKNSEKTKNKFFTIVIPGSVSQNRRDYNKIIDKISELEISLKKGSRPKDQLIEFIFLGKAKGKELKKITDLERTLNHIDIQYFSDRVSSEIFDEWMRKADVLWCPIQKETEFFSQREIYGKTKMTGNLGDAVTYGKPAVFPENYTSKLEFIIPEKENILDQFQEMENFTFDFEEKYSKEKIQNNLEAVLHQLIST